MKNQSQNRIKFKALFSLALSGLSLLTGSVAFADPMDADVNRMNADDFGPGFWHRLDRRGPSRRPIPAPRVLPGCEDAGAPGLFNCPAGMFPASFPLLDGTMLRAGTAVQVSTYRVEAYDTVQPNWILGRGRRIPVWFRQGITMARFSDGRFNLGACQNAGQPGVFNCPGSVLPASTPLRDGSILAGVNGTVQVSTYPVPAYDTRHPNWIIGGFPCWFREVR